MALATAASLALTLSVALAAPVPKKSIDVPAGDAATTLKLFAQQSGEQIVYPLDQIRGVKTNAVKGEIASREALDQMLAGTGLVVVQDEKTGALSVRRAPGPNAPRVVPEAAATPIAQGKIENGKVVLDKYEVTGSRIRRDPMEMQANPVTVFSRTEIDRSGASNIADFVGRITQLSASLTEQSTNSLPTSGRTTVSLRGLGNNTTLILVNGRRVPKSGQGFNEDGYDLNGIPLGAVDRVEVLTDGASAVYGSDAIGGVINIITRTDYSGAELSLHYGNTFAADAGERTVEVTVGRSGVAFGGKKYSVFFAASAYARNALAALDRPYTAQSDYSASGGRPAPLENLFDSAVAGAGRVKTNLDYTTFAYPNLPGFTTPSRAIPPGQNGRHLTLADFQNYSGGVQAGETDQPDYTLLLSPQQRYSGSGSFKLEWSDRLQVFLDASYSLFKAQYSGRPPTGSIPLLASNPFNPFGIDVTVDKTFYELGPSQGRNETETARVSTGLRGDLASGWHYEVAVTHDRYADARTTPMPGSINFYPTWTNFPDGTSGNVETPASLWTYETDPATALNAFGDGRVSQPIDLARLRTMLGVDDYAETSEMWTGDFNTGGPVFSIRAGAVKLAAGGEFRREEVRFEKLNTSGSYWISLDSGARRDVSAGYAELSVPLTNAAQKIPALNRLELTFAGRADYDRQFGTETTPRVGLLWKPAGAFALRANYGLGYKVPTLSQLTEPAMLRSTWFVYGPPVDPVTGALVIGPIDTRTGGNPDLDPERSRSINIGVIYEPAGVKNFSVSVDYFDIDYTDKVFASVDPQAILDSFPERVGRDPVGGHVVYLDLRPINLARARARGYDVKLTYRYETASAGQIDVRINGTYNRANSQQNTPDIAATDNLARGTMPRVRANADLFWTYRRYELGTSVTFESSSPNQLYGATAPVRVRQAVVCDLQAGYDFGSGRAPQASGWTRGLKFTVGVLNLFDREPSPTNGDGGYAKIDPRQRRYYLSLRKTF